MTLEIIKDYCIWIFPICSAILFLGGVFGIICASLNLKFFMQHPKAVEIIQLKGQRGAKMFYIKLGILSLIFSFTSLAFWLVLRNLAITANSVKVFSFIALAVPGISGWLLKIK